LAEPGFSADASFGICVGTPKLPLKPSARDAGNMRRLGVHSVREAISTSLLVVSRGGAMTSPSRRRSLNLLRIAVTTAFAFALSASTSAAAELKVLTSRITYQVLTELAGEFQRTSGHRVALILVAPAEVRRRILNGEIVDVAMSREDIIDDLVQQNRIARNDKLTFARVGVGVAVRAGSPKPDIASVEAFKRTLLAARSIVYIDPATGGASGIQFEKVLDRLGIAKEIKAKSILNAQGATRPNAEIVARGEAELGIQTTAKS